MGKKFPLISIVTPSLNQGLYIEENIKSVLDQNYPNFEHIIIDGGSTDGTVDILRKYDHVIWVSEKDSGQSEAINKGFKRANGEIIGWLNSDDNYEPGAFNIVVRTLNKPEGKYIIFGDCNIINRKGQIVDFRKGKYRNQRSLIEYWKDTYIPQPTVFFYRDLFYEIGLLNENLRYAMDWDFWLRISEKYSLFYINKTLANFRVHEQQKTKGLEVFEPELYKLSRKYWGSKFSLKYWWYYLLSHNCRSFITITKAYEMRDMLTIKNFIKLIIISLVNNPINVFRKKFVSILLRGIFCDKHIERMKCLLGKI